LRSSQSAAICDCSFVIEHPYSAGAQTGNTEVDKLRITRRRNLHPACGQFLPNKT
jgi:hypothetical protein